MNKLDITSKNSNHLSELISFAGELFNLCKAVGINPILYGSLACAYHTGDSSMDINDIDLLVPENSLEKLVELLRGDEYSHELTTYHSLKIFKSDLEISFDGIEHYLADLPHEGVPAEINGVNFAVVSRETLKEVYRRGADTIPFKSEAYALKLRALERG